jgi:hypothetical protein
MPELVRFDTDEFVVNHKSSMSQGCAVAGVIWFGAIVGGNLVAILSRGDWRKALPGGVILVLLILALCVLVCLPEYLRLRFADRSYQIVTGSDLLMLRREGRKGSFDEFDRLRFTQEAGEPSFEGEIRFDYEIQLFWQHEPRRPYPLLGTSFGGVDARGLAEWREMARQLAEKLGVPLEDRSELRRADRVPRKQGGRGWWSTLATRDENERSPRTHR